MDENDIHKAYDYMKKQDISCRAHARKLSSRPSKYSMGRQAPSYNLPRANAQPFSSRPFHTGEGILTVPSGQTVLLAKKVVPNNHGGVLQSLGQFFDDINKINSVTWSLRIDGLPVIDFPDWVGKFGTIDNPIAFHYILSGGAATLGNISLSPDSTSSWSEVPTVTLSATNNASTDTVLQGRIMGYTFPLAERNDEFSNF